jgi:ABC-2 type transport system ATP-binding protein
VLQNTSVRELLTQLCKQTFYLDLPEAQETAPTIEGFDVRLTGPHLLEVEVDREQRLNEVFAQLSRQGVEVSSMRPRSNRLEELFLSLVGKGHKL